MIEHQRNSLAQNVISVFAGQVGAWLITAVTFAILPRYLGATKAGIFSVGSTFGALAGTVAGLGITTLLIREVARDREKGAELVGTAIWLSFVLGAAAGAAATTIGFLLGYSNLTMLAIVISCAGIPFGLIGGVVISVMQGVERMRWASALDVLTKLCWLVIVLLVIALDLGIPGVLFGSLAMLVAMSSLQLMVVRHILRFTLKNVSLTTAVSLIRRSVPFLMASIFFTLYTSTDIVLLSRLSDEASVGIYSAPMRLFGTMLFVPVAITTVIFPRLSVSLATDREAAARLGRKALKVAVFASFALSLAAVSLSDDALVRILGDSYRGSGPVFVALAISLVPTSISIVASRMIFAADRQSVVSILGAGAFVAKVLLGFLLIPLFDARWGNPALGAAVGLVLVEFGMTVGMIRAVPATLFDGASRKFFARLGAASCGAVAVVVIVYQGSPLMAGAAGLGSYALLSVAFGAVRPRVVLGVCRMMKYGLSSRSVAAQ
jgi:O-antigen/teichoic acid export membrane protein